MTTRTPAIKLYHTLNMTTEAWREHRNEGLGGSDVSAILGINRYRTPLQVYMEKTGQWEPDDLSENQAVHFGHKLEGLVAEEFAERTGLKVQRNNFMLQHPYYPWMLANIDREIFCPKRGRGVLECKTTSAWNDEWTDDEIPPAYMLQVQHYLAVTGYEYAFIALLKGGNTYEHWEINRDEDLINMLIEAESNFWNNHILAQDPPEVNYQRDGRGILDKLYPAETAKEDTIALSGERVKELLEQVWAIEQEMKELGNHSEAFKSELKDLIKEYEKAEHDQAVITWKAPKPSFTVATKDLKAKYPEVFEELKREKKNSRRFTIKFKK